MVKAILFDIENTLLCPEVPAVQRFAALRLHGEPLFTETTAREAVRQAELWTARQILHELETGTRMDDAQFFRNVCAVYRAAAAQQGAEVGRIPQCIDRTAHVQAAQPQFGRREEHVFDHARGVRKGDVRDFPDGDDDESGRSVYRVGGLVPHFFPRHFQKFGKRVFACDAADAQAVVSAHPDGRAERRRHDLSERGVLHGRAFKIAHRSSRFDAVESFHMFSPCPFL